MASMRRTTTREGSPPEDSIRGVVAFGVVSLFSDVAHETVTTVLPMLMAVLGAPPIGLGLIEGCADAAATLSKLFSGRMADRLHRKKPATLLGYAVTAVAMPVVGVATSVAQMVALRTIAWIGRGFRSPLRDVLLIANVPDHRRGAAFGLERAMDQCGALLAPLLVYLALHFGWSPRDVILAAAIPGALCVLAFAALVREASPEAAAVSARAPAMAPISPEATARFRRFTVAILIFGCGDFAKTLLILWGLGSAAGSLGPSEFGAGALLYAWFNLVTIGAAYFGGRLSDRVGRRGVLVFGYAVGVLSACVPVFTAPSIGAAALALGLSGVLVGIEEAVERAAAADLAPGGKTGLAFGLFHTANGVGDLVASAAIVGGIWYLLGPRWAFGTAAAVMALGTIAIARALRPPAQRACA